MSEGSLQLQITVLATAVDGVQALLGKPPSDGDPGSGLAAAAALSASSPFQQIGQPGNGFEARVRDLLAFDPASGVTEISELFADLDLGTKLAPTAALASFEQHVERASTVFSADFAGRLAGFLDAVRGLSKGIPENRIGVLSPLLDQLLGALESLEGPEAEKIQAWIRSVTVQHRELLPLIEAAGSDPDPTALVVRIFERALDGVLDTFGYGPVKRLLLFFDSFPRDAVDQAALTDVSARLDAVFSAYAKVEAARAADFPVFRDATVAAVDEMRALRDGLRPLTSAVRRITRARILQPGALEAFLRQAMEQALAVQVQETQKIDDPYKELLDRIDQAIDGIDLKSAREEVLGFFTATRKAVEQVDAGGVADALEKQLASVDQAVRDLQQGVSDLLSQVEGHFDGLVERLRGLFGRLGTFEADGRFRFRFEDDLRAVLSSARLAVAGNPQDADAPSVAAALKALRGTLDGFLRQLEGLLEPVASSAGAAAKEAAEGIEAFAKYLSSLDVPGLMEQLRQDVEKILDALAPIDFSPVVDPVVEGLEENAAKLDRVDVEELNDLLRAALVVAKDLLDAINFAGEIKDPLRAELKNVKAVPAKAIEELQKRYEQAMSALEELGPERLLRLLSEALGTVRRALGELDAKDLLKPLDALHRRYLQEPLAALGPAALLAPVSTSFKEQLAIFDAVRGKELIAPLDAELAKLKSAVAGFRIDDQLAELLAAVEKVKKDLREIRPSKVVGPLVADFGRLEDELDRFKPSRVFEPVKDLAGPLLGFLKGVQQDLVTALFELFKKPLADLDRLEPEALAGRIRDAIGQVLDLLRALDLPNRYTRLKGDYFDLATKVQADGDPLRVELATHLDPELQIGDIVGAYSDLVAALERMRSNLALPDLAALYGELRERLRAMLPPYARKLLDPEAFRRVMRQANPLRFLDDLDQRFETVKARLLPIRPEELAAELDAAHKKVLGLVDGVKIGDRLKEVAKTFERLRGVVETIRVDFLATDVDKAVAEVRAVVEALDPARLGDALDPLHQALEEAVGGTIPSKVLAEIDAPLGRVQDLIEKLDPDTVLKPALKAWDPAVKDALAAVDFTVVLSPLVDKLDELEAELVAALDRSEMAFQHLLDSARGAVVGRGASAEERA